jgi:hypothetical protein
MWSCAKLLMIFRHRNYVSSLVSCQGMSSLIEHYDMFFSRTDLETTSLKLGTGCEEKSRYSTIRMCILSYSLFPFDKTNEQTSQIEIVNKSFPKMTINSNPVGYIK